MADGRVYAVVVVLDARLRQLLVCPACRGDLQDCEAEDGPVLRCVACALDYPVVDGIPHLVSELARGAPES
jgi:uncharacterized protein YbaR (Trm112 family)